MRNIKISRKSIKEAISGESAAIKGSVRDEMVRWLRAMDAQYHLTLTFPYSESEAMCKRHLNDLLHRLNYKIFKNHYSKLKSSCLTGVVVMEDTPAKDTVHFHILIEGQEYLPKMDRMRNLIAKAVASLNSGGSKRIDKFQIDRYRLEEGKSLEKYLTKSFESNESDLAVLDRFAYLSVDGLCFGELGNTSRYGQLRSFSGRKLTASG